ncbi:MAG: flagellar filament capping protein FliD [Nitrospinae bacterium]|nr:flagellar filament capping protein FliD [Nitrospinota bacterium]
MINTVSSYLNYQGHGMSDVVAGSFWFMKRDVPGVVLIDSASSAVKAKDTLKELEKIPNNSPILDKINFGSRFLNLKDSSFDDLSKNLSYLGASSQSLSNKESFNIHKGVSSNSDIADIRIGFGSPDGIYQMKVHQPAAGHRIASDEFSDPHKSLSLSGSFTINGYTISVTASDSLNDIKDKINWGEDINKNGKLDLAEDLNKNGAIDSFFVKGVKSGGVYMGSVSIFEDINSNGKLDSSEDINNNEKLDGGSSQINVTASIERNRLMLTATLQGDKKISMTDTNGILLSLGFFQLDGRGVSVQKEQQLLSSGENLNKEPQKAVISINGTKYERNTNAVSDIIPDTTINIKKESDSDITVTISSDINVPLNNIKGFVDSFNRTLKFINDQIASDRMLNKDEAVQNIRKDMVDNAYNEIQSDDGNNRISEIGIEKDKSERRNSNQLSLTNLLLNLKEQLTGLPSKGENSIFASLDEVGITSIENDTLKINEDRLTESLKNNIDGTYKILSGVSDSVTARLTRQMDSALNPKTGTIKFRKDVINYYIQNQNVVRDFLKDKQTITQTKIEGKSKTTVLSKVA